MTPPSKLRLYLLRACYLLLVVGLAFMAWPNVVFGAAGLPAMEGAVYAMLGALGLLSVVGLWAPLRMLPLLLFEIAWKVIWTLSVAVPALTAGGLSAAQSDILFSCAFAIPFVFIFPWRYFAARCFAGDKVV